MENISYVIQNIKKKTRTIVHLLITKKCRKVKTVVNAKARLIPKLN